MSQPKVSPPGFPFSTDREPAKIKRSLSYRLHHLYRWISPGHSYLAAVAENRLLSQMPFFVSDLPPEDLEDAVLRPPNGESDSNMDQEVAERKSMDSLDPSQPFVNASKSTPKTWNNVAERFDDMVDRLKSNHLNFKQPHVDPSKVVARVGYVKLDAPNEYMNTLVIGRTDDDGSQDRNCLVLAHGFAAGLGFFYKNFNGLAKSLVEERGWRIYAIDWLGMGRSSRSQYPRNTTQDKTGNSFSRVVSSPGSDDSSPEVQANIDQAESFFIDALDQWRTRLGINKMTLMGHSLGGYLAGAYTRKYPSRVSHLLLVSPVGVPYKPPGYVFGQGGSYLFNVVAKLWESHYTPQGLIRAIGPMGPRIIQGYAQRRFHFLPRQEVMDFKAYIYNIVVDKGAGEYALNHILAPGAYARRPLAQQLPGVKVPMTFLYGDIDWMDHRHARDIQNQLYNAKVDVLPDAGHHLYLDNPKAFNDTIIAHVLGRAAK